LGLKQDLKKLYDDLDYWIFIGIGDDIVKAKEQRPEYKPLVLIAKNRGIDSSKIPRVVKYLLHIEKGKFILFSKIAWLVLTLKVKSKVNDFLATFRGKL
jgi:hypothetical protein